MDRLTDKQIEAFQIRECFPELLDLARRAKEALEKQLAHDGGQPQPRPRIPGPLPA